MSAHWSGANSRPQWTPRGSCATGVVTLLPDWTECFALFFPSVAGVGLALGLALGLGLGVGVGVGVGVGFSP